MRNWKTRKALYEITEFGKKINCKFCFIGTGDEITEKLNGMNEMNGYIPGLGGDKYYAATAVLLEYMD